MAERSGSLPEEQTGLWSLEVPPLQLKVSAVPTPSPYLGLRRDFRFSDLREACIAVCGCRIFRGAAFMFSQPRLQMHLGRSEPSSEITSL